MKRTALIFVLILTIPTVFTTSCKKGSGCYDEVLYQKHKNDICTMDCPGVVGCDGKIYCNGCVANRNGIRVK